MIKHGSSHCQHREEKKTLKGFYYVQTSLTGQKSFTAYLLFIKGLLSLVALIPPNTPPSAGI